MDCDTCGAALEQGAENCPECGAAAAVAELTETETVADADATGSEAPVEPAAEPATGDSDGAETGSAAPSDAAGEPSAERPGWMTALIALAIVAALAVGGYFGWQAVMNAGNTPAAAAERMLAAYAKYDAQGILDNATHGDMPAEALKEFEQQAAEAKKNAKGKDGVKDIKVSATKVDAKDPNKATVTVDAKWLTDPAKGTYEQRSEELQMVREKGKWLVRLFF